MGSIGRILAAWSHSIVGAGDMPVRVLRVRQQRGIAREGGARERNHIRIHADLAALPQPAIGFAQGFGDVLQGRARRAQDQIEERRDAQLQRRGEHRLDVAMDLALVELLEHVAREALDAEAQHAKAGAAHGRESLRRHRIDAIGADELQILRNACRAVSPRRSHRTAAGRAGPS